MSSLNWVYQGDNLPILQACKSETFDLVYLDPPFNTGKVQSRTRIKTEGDEGGDRVGFQGRRYTTTELGTTSFADSFTDYIGFLRPRLEELHRLLTPTGSLFFHIDYREAHYCKIMLDEIFGRDCFQNEIIWAYDYGARSKSKWPAKHDSIFWYTKDPKHYVFNLDECDHIKYMAPDLVGAEKAAKGKTPTDVWWHTIVPTNGKERTGYATQKPMGILERIIKVHTNPGDMVLDCFAGSGTTGEAAAKNGRRFVMIDNNPDAIAVMETRLRPYGFEMANTEKVA